jgi:ATPase subunit of ABC transporter with duplicated ATPase domains
MPRMTSDAQVIYSMVRVGRIHPPNKQVLRDISLGFYYGAEIGVLGLNGAGKSRLLRIMAGVDTDYVGEIAKSKGYTVGLLEQEPVLDESKTMIEVVREGVQPVVDMLKRFDEVNSKFAEPDATSYKHVRGSLCHRRRGPARQTPYGPAGQDAMCRSCAHSAAVHVRVSRERATVTKSSIRRR